MRFSMIVIGLIFVINPVFAQDMDVARLKELEAASKPPQQTDLDTFKLASAHRERADSMREKTNGLWQSWLVSICEGCGPERKPYFKRDASQFSEKAAPNAVADRGKSSDMGKVAVARPQKRNSVITIAADLSDNNIDQIRKTPNQ